MLEHRTHVTCEYNDGTPMGLSDRRWYLWLGIAGYTAAGVVLLSLVGLVLLGGWVFVVMLIGMSVIGYGLIEAGDRLEQQSERRKEKKRKKSAQPE